MRKTAIILLALLAACSSKPKKKHVIDQSQKPHYLYVISSYEGTLKDKELVLNAVPLVVYFSDRPHRVAGHMHLKDFITQWYQESKKEPPNATLAIVDGSKMKEASLELTDPQIKDDKLQFKVKVLKNGIPNKFEASSLFIDSETTNPPPN